jgi:ABC-type polysaccharide/polyol phosphate export permease
MLYLLKSIAQHSALLKDLVARDLKARYVGSSMGFFWSILFPVINLLVFTFVFRVILNTRWGDEQGALEVSLVMLAGIIVWTAFAESLSRATNCLVDNSNLIQKVVFPSQILPAYITASAVINMCIGLPIVLGAVVWFGFLSPPQAAIERETAFAEVWEAYDPGAEGATPPPRVFVSTERSWHSSTRYRLEYTGTATRGVDYAAPTDVIELPADRSRIYVPVIPLRDAETEGDETIQVRLIAESTVELWQREVVITLKDNALPPAEVRDLGLSTEPYTSESLGRSRALSLGVSLLALPGLLLLLIGFTTGLGAGLATLNLYWRDTFHLVGVGTTVWMFATPIFYPGPLVAKTPFWWLLDINPMHWYIAMFRQVTLYGEWPATGDLVKFTVATGVVMFLGLGLFKRHQDRFPDLL